MKVGKCFFFLFVCYCRRYVCVLCLCCCYTRLVLFAIDVSLVIYSCVCLVLLTSLFFPLLMYLIAFLALGAFSCTARLRGRACNLCCLLLFFCLRLRCSRSSLCLTLTERKHSRVKLVLNWPRAWNKPVFSGRTYQYRGCKLELPVLNGTFLLVKHFSSLEVPL